MYIRKLQSYNANFFSRISFTVKCGEISRVQFTVVFNHLVHYSPWRNETINVSLKNQAFMQDCYNKQFCYV